MLAQNAIKDLLRLLGRSKLTSASYSGSDPQEARPEDTRACLLALNGAIQELFALTTGDHQRRDFGFLIGGTDTIAFDATHGSTAITNFDVLTNPGFNSDDVAKMRGCTIRAAGEDHDNELKDDETLIMPWAGPTGAATATLYYDVLNLPEVIREVGGDIYLADRYILGKAEARGMLYSAAWKRGDIDNYVPFGTPQSFVNVSSVRPVPGQPDVYFIDSVYDPDDGNFSGLQQRLRMRFSPLPDMEYPVRFTALVKPQYFTTSDVGTDASIVVTPLMLPNDWTESTLLAVAKQRMLGDPYVGVVSQQLRDEIGRAYRQAIKIMEATRPDGDGYSRMPPPYPTDPR